MIKENKIVKVRGVKVYGGTLYWKFPSDAHPYRYYTPIWYKYFLLILDRLRILPLYYSPYVWEFPQWRISSHQREVILMLLHSHQRGDFSDGDSEEFLRVLSTASHYSFWDKRRLNELLFSYWEFYGEFKKLDRIWNPYPPKLKWKIHMDTLLKREFSTNGTTYEYE